MLQTLQDVGLSTWLVLGEMSPYLLIGFAVAGALSVFVTKSWVERHLGGRGWSPVVKATVMGVPLPLCSCGVIPVSASLYRHGASRGSTSAFLLSTPQTGVDSILATFGMLGPVLAIVRPAVALVSGVLGGFAIDAATRHEPKEDTAQPIESGCCEGNGGDDCCTPDESPRASWSQRVAAGLRYGLITLPRDIAKPLLLGAALAGALSVLVGDSLAAYLGHPVLGMAIMLAIGVPVYVCATGSIPLAVAFIHMGASPGAALVFLIAGPATNMATIAVTWKLLGRRTAVMYLVVTAVTALGAGVGLDLLWTEEALRIPELAHTHDHGHAGWPTHAWAAAIVAMLVASIFWPKRPGGGEPVDTGATEAASGQTVELQIDGMRCSHCTDAAAQAIRESPGVREANVDLSTGRAVVRGLNMSREALVAAIEGVGYRVVG